MAAGGATVACFRLPVSGLAVELRHPTGVEDLLLIEAAGGDTGLALALAQRLVRATDGTVVEWGGLSVSDLDVLILRLRQALVGDRVRAEVMCRAAGCGRRIDVSFSIGEYLAHHVPTGTAVRGWSVSSSDEPGWFCLASTARTSPAFDPPPARLSAGVVATGKRLKLTRVLFRLPTVLDQLSVAGHPDAEGELVRRCIRPAELPSHLRRLVEATMEAMAPSLSRDLQGVCPECGASVTVYFDARKFCLQELRRRAVFVYEDIDILAQRYHWSEHEILAMPHTRRANYAELARQRGSP
jgi:hypothetical protein